MTVSCWVLPGEVAAICTEAGETAIDCRIGASTIAVKVAVTVPTETRMLAVPGATAATRPVEETVTTPVGEGAP